MWIQLNSSLTVEVEELLFLVLRDLEWLHLRVIPGVDGLCDLTVVWFVFPGFDKIPLVDWRWHWSQRPLCRCCRRIWCLPGRDIPTWPGSCWFHLMIQLEIGFIISAPTWHPWHRGGGSRWTSCPSGRGTVRWEGSEGQFEQGYSFDIRNISSSLAHPEAVDDCGFHLAPDDRVGLCVGRGAVVPQLDHVHPPV